MILRRTPCERYRRALTDFVDRRERGPQTGAALEHLERCPRCERELSAIALAIFAMRRVGTEVASAWPRADLVPPRPPAARRLRLHGLRSAVVGPLVSVVVVALVARGVGVQPAQAPTVAPAAVSSPVVRIYEPPLAPAPRPVVQIPMRVGVPAAPPVARLLPVARDRATPDPEVARVSTWSGSDAPATPSVGPT